MVLEATMICLDNSDWANNGDFSQNRLEAQEETANLLCGAKVQNNPENSIGLLTMGGSKVNVCCAPTSDLGIFLQALHAIPCSGKADFIRGIQTAQLALKHRLNRNQRQRIILFVCSPMEADDKQLESLGRTLKKNNIAIDIVSFGEVSRNAALVQKLYTATNSNETSHLLEVSDKSVALSRAVMYSAIVGAEGGMPMDGMDDLGVDPSADPELYEALRLSLEEERARTRRQEEQARREAEQAAQAAGGGTEPAAGANADMGEPSQGQ